MAKAPAGIPDYLADLDLAPKQAMFVLEYLIDMNAAAAAQRAGYSPQTANQQGARMLANVKVARGIERATAARVERLEYNADALLTRLVAEVDADIADLFDDDDNLLPIKKWPKIWRTGLLAGLETEELFEKDQDGNKERVGQARKIKFSDRMKRLEAIGRHVKVQAFKDTQIVEPSSGLTKLFEQISGNSIRPKAGKARAR